MSDSAAPPDAELLTAQQVSTMVNMGHRTWWRLVASGRAPAPVRLGRIVRWRRRELMEWIEADCPRTTPPCRGL